MGILKKNNVVQSKVIGFKVTEIRDEPVLAETRWNHRNFFPALSVPAASEAETYLSGKHSDSINVIIDKKSETDQKNEKSQIPLFNSLRHSSDFCKSR